MKRSLLRYSAWISLLFIAAVSCRSSGAGLSGIQAYEIRDSIIGGSFEKATFKAKVTCRDMELSGLLLIKNAGDENYKNAIYNELGMTYLEGTFANSSKHKKLVVKNIAPVINYKIFVKNFEKSFRIIFSDKIKPRSPASPPPSLPASPLPELDENILKVQLRSGFILELSSKK